MKGKLEEIQIKKTKKTYKLPDNFYERQIGINPNRDKKMTYKYTKNLDNIPGSANQLSI